MNFLKSPFLKIVLPLFALSLFSVGIYFSSPMLYKYFTALMPIIIIVNPGTSAVAGTAYGENIGYILFLTDIGSIATPRIVDSNTFMGYGISQDVGYISLNCANTNSCATSDYKVTVNERGHLSGYAYGENVGYINFDPIVDGVDYGVTIDENGYFHGWAYGESVGWISFNCANTNSCTGDGGVNYKVASTAKFLDPVPTTIQIVTQPVANSCSNYLSVQPAISVQDQYGYSIENGITVTAGISGGTGQILGTTTAQTIDGIATFSGLGYDKTGEIFSISFAVGNYSISSNSLGPITLNCQGSSGYVDSSFGLASGGTPDNSVNEDNGASPNGSQNISVDSGQNINRNEIPVMDNRPINSGGEEIKAYVEEKIDVVKGNIPKTSPKHPQVILILQKMIDALKSLLGLAG